MEMATADDEDLKIKPKPRKRKPKKVIPVGKNGLKKRRVEKSRQSFDEKGYMGMSLFHFFHPRSLPEFCTVPNVKSGH
jgi:hypothetical protein